MLTLICMVYSTKNSSCYSNLTYVAHTFWQFSKSLAFSSQHNPDITLEMFWFPLDPEFHFLFFRVTNHIQKCSRLWLEEPAASDSSETSVTLYQTTRRHIAEFRNVHSHILFNRLHVSMRLAFRHPSTKGGTWTGAHWQCVIIYRLELTDSVSLFIDWSSLTVCHYL
jgi:hypothetical protein